MASEQLQNELEDKTAALAAAEEQIVKLHEEIKRLKGNGGTANGIQHEPDDANNRLTELINNLDTGVIVVDENRKIVLINQSYCDLFAITADPSSLIASNGAQILDSINVSFSDPAEYLSRAEKLIAEKKPVLKEEIKMANGRVFYRDYIPVFFNGNYRGHMWQFTDVTPHKTIEETLDAQRNFYEHVLNNIPADIAVFSKEHRYLFLNPIAVSKPDLRKWMIGKNDEEYCLYTNKPLSIAEKRRELFNGVKDAKVQKEWEEKLVKPDGSTEYHLRKMYPVIDDNGEVDMVIGYGINITTIKKIQEQIKISEKRYRDIFNFSLAWICTHDMQGKIVSINKAACEILEYTEEELVGKGIEEMIPERLRSQFSDTYLAKITEEGKAEGIMSILSKGKKKAFLLYQNHLVSEPGSEPYVIGFAQNITERIHAEEALKRSEEKYRGIIENMNLGMTEIDNEERIVYANQRFCAMSGYDLEELAGKKATDLFLEGTHLRMVSNHISQQQPGRSQSIEVAVKTKNGENKWWLISAAPILNPDGSVKGTIGIHLDITKQKKLQQQLREAKLDADKSSKSKDVFLTNMSHEIRTPLNAIMGLGKLLGKSDITTQQKSYLNGIESAAENLLGIINDLLDFSKIEAGKITIENISFNLENICQQIVNILTHKTEEKGLLLTYQVDERIAPALLGDPYRINQVFMNMLSNAIKFTEHGSISLNAQLIEEKEEEQKVVITIKDTGVGIKEEYIDKLFDKFTQEDETVVRKFGGTGLGMSITRQLMELMGGSIQVESQKNVGTTIILSFNFKIGVSRVIEKKKTIKNDTSNISGKKILLVEDNNLNRLLAHTILTEYGGIITEAVNGAEAVELMRDNTYDVVLMDIQMPVMDGIQATKIIRKDINTTTPIIALTANAIKGKLEEYLQAGMDDFIYKPYDEIKLVNPISKWINKMPLAAGGARATEEVSHVAPAAPVQETVIAAPSPTAAKQPVVLEEVDLSGPLYDLTTLKNIGRNDMGFITKMLQLFVEETPPAAHKIKEAYDAGDFATVKYLAHRMKPSITNMGILSIKNEILQIELQAEKATRTAELDNFVHKVYTVVDAVVAQLKLEYTL